MKSVQRGGMVAAVAVVSSMCWAQPNDPPAPRAPAPDVAALLARVDAGAANFAKTMRDRRGERWQSARLALRKRLDESGFGVPVQDAVLAFAERQDAVREVVREAAALCVHASRNKRLRDAEIQDLLED